MTHPLTSLLEKAFASCVHLFEECHESTFRLFNGFFEDCPDLAVDVHGRTLK